MEKKSKKVTRVGAVQPVEPVADTVAVPVKTQAEKMWDEIKDVRLEMFALPNQFVHTHYDPMIIDHQKLHLRLKTKATSVLTALEAALGRKYTVELVDKFVVVALAPAR